MCIRDRVLYNVKHEHTSPVANFFVSLMKNVVDIKFVWVSICSEPFAYPVVLDGEMKNIYDSCDLRMMVCGQKPGHYTTVYQQDFDKIQAPLKDQFSTLKIKAKRIHISMCFVGNTQDDGKDLLKTPHRLATKQPSLTRRPITAAQDSLQEVPDPPQQLERISPNRKATRLRPSFELKDLPTRLAAAASDEEKRTILLGVHERLWHAPPADMVKILQSLLISREYQAMAADVASCCHECRKFARRMARPKVKSSVASVFNEVVQHDLFFLFDQTFVMSLIHI